MIVRREVVLVLQIGSLGDTVISLPCYREIARRHPGADIYLMTNFPIGRKMVPAESVLVGTGMIKGSIPFPMPLRDPGEIVALRRRIAVLRPSMLYYLLPERRLFNLVRHYIFFRLSGVRQICGMPWRREQRHSQPLGSGEIWESEARRLLRCIGVTNGVPTDEDRDLALTPAEMAKAGEVIASFAPAAGFVAISVGGKVPLNNWGDENWCHTLRLLSRTGLPLGAVFVGSADERPRNDVLSSEWNGPTINTCGQLSPRETAAVISRAALFLGHDTGTLHLAAAVGTPVVGVFSARNMPGVWYSDRARDVFFYDRVPCAGCQLVSIPDCPNGHRCMQKHDIAAVVAEAVRLLAQHRGGIMQA